MSIMELKRNSVPIDLRVKIEPVMHDENLSWKETLVFLATKVVSSISGKNTSHTLFARKVVSPPPPPRC